MQQAEREWLARLPVRDMVRYGWILPTDNPRLQAAECLRFFDVESVPVWRHKYSRLRELAAFRTSPSFEVDAAATAAWLRQGQIEAGELRCAPWEAASFEEELVVIRRLTTVKDPDAFLPRLQSLCAKCGVACVVLRAPLGCRASGAAYFMSPDKAVVQLSFRYLTDDQFWFSFFHEAGHLLIHGPDHFFLELAKAASTDEEREANSFAASILVPPEFQQRMMELGDHWAEIVRFAVQIGVAPGVVVGQLQYFGKLRRNQLNRLKRRFAWED